MPMDIINTLEVIDIQKQQRQGALVVLRRSKGRLHSLIEQRAVGQCCQWIMMGQEA
ncbi:hypothetical protein D3C81_2074620 [compost metagenome]